MSTTRDYTPQKVNANRHTARGMGALQDSIQRDGWIGALTVAADGEAFDGSARIEVGARAGFDDAIIVESDGSRPIVHVRTDIAHADDDRARRLGVAANRVAQLNLSFSPDVLQHLSQQIDISPLWTTEELTDLFAEQQRETVTQDDPGPQLDKAEELRKKWDVHTGQLWQLGEHRLLCGDCLNRESISRLIKADKVEALITDPPYGIQEQTNRYSKGRGNAAPAYDFPSIHGDDAPFDPAPFLAYPFILLWGANYFADKLPCVPSWLIWDKRDGVVGDDNADVEMAWCNDRKPARLFRHLWKGMIKASEQDIRRSHPTQKPVALLEWCIERAGNVSIIYDPFSGSGTTLIACERRGRRCRAIEISPAYVAVALQRWADMTSKEPQLL